MADTHLCAICWEVKPEVLLVRESTGYSQDEEQEAEEAPVGLFEERIEKRKRHNHWWHCREECCPPGKRYVFTGEETEWYDPRNGVFFLPALLWLEVKTWAWECRFRKGEALLRAWVKDMAARGRVQERDGLVWTVPLAVLHPIDAPRDCAAPAP